MWEFETLLFDFFISSLSAAWVVRALTPWFWAYVPTQADVLIKVATIPEIDNAVYVSWLVVFVLCFFTVFFITKSVLHQHPRFSRAIEIINRVLLLYFVIVPHVSLFTIDAIRPLYLAISLIIYFVFEHFGPTVPALTEILLGFAVVRFGWKPLLHYDVSPNHYLLLFDYVFVAIALMVTGYGYFLYRFFSKFRAFVRSLAARFPLKTLAAIVILGITISILHLLTQGKDPIDMYFTLIPAYQFLHGGTPLVSMTSQYGLGYLVPWILWLSLLGHVPITYQAGAVASAIFLIGYYYLFVRVMMRLVPNRFVFVGTVLAGYYFSLLVVSYGFLEKISDVLTPAFTPLRFGVFLFPLAILMRYVKNGTSRDLRWFFAVSSVCFFFSFEIGIGILLAGGGIALIHGITNSKHIKRRLASDMAILAGTLLLCTGLLMEFALLRTGIVPNLLSFGEYSGFFASGYLMLPIGAEPAVFVPVGVALFACIFGIRRIFHQKDRGGYLWVYLALIMFFEFPYYMGRSVFQTLYDISLPYIILCGVITQYSLSAVRSRVRRAGWWIAIGVCGYILFMGGFRGFFIVGETVLHSAEVVVSAVAYTHVALTQWDIKATPQYAFLKKNLPKGCPLILFDVREYELLTASGSPPAFNYGMVRGFITHKEQMDALKPFPGAARICVFVNGTTIALKDDLINGVYVYFWKKYGTSARTIAQEQTQQFSLYEIPVVQGSLE